jgi:uncharacterized protein YbjT (DUF2867 family)
MESVVLGATGIVGDYIAQRLLLSGEKPFAFVDISTGGS